MNKTPSRLKKSHSLLIFALLFGATNLSAEKKSDSEEKCPVIGSQIGKMSNNDWWPNKLNLRILHQNSQKGNPMPKGFSYAEEFAKMDLGLLKKDLKALMNTSQKWWPADFGHYGPFFVRLAWHSAGTYRSYDGRGGTSYGLQRFAPQNSWPDNGNLDKARRLLWPIKKKYGNKISWADLMIFAGTVAIEDMGLKTFGFGGGRQDVWEPQEDIIWGPEKKWLDDQRHDAEGKLKKHLAADQMGLIYVNPEGPHGNPDPLAAAVRIRETFSRMGMNDQETVALIAGGHTFGKAHGAASPKKYVGPEPEAAAIEEQGLGWKSSFGKGNAEDTITSGLEGAWTTTPTKWSHQYFTNLFSFEWELTKSPAKALQWQPKNGIGKGMVPDAHDATKRHSPMMFTTDIALKKDPIYKAISKRFLSNPLEFDKAFAKAWFKLTHRDMGSHSNLLGALVPAAQLWQDPVPKVDYELADAKDILLLKKQILTSGLSTSELVSTAWASASTFRQSDQRGGSNGARIRLAPQNKWKVNKPNGLAKVLSELSSIQKGFNDDQKSGKKISIADLIVLGAAGAIEQAANKAGHKIMVPFFPGRTDASQEMTDKKSFSLLEPSIDGFRNFAGYKSLRPLPELLLNRAQLLSLTAPEMTVLIGGMRVLGTNSGYSRLGAFTKKKGVLSNDFFVNLLDMKTKWKKSKEHPGFYEGVDTKTAEVKWAATSVDLIFGSNSQLRAIAEVYATDGAEKTFIKDFVSAWVKVMNLGIKQ